MSLSLYVNLTPVADSKSFDHHLISTKNFYKKVHLVSVLWVCENHIIKGSVVTNSELNLNRFPSG